MRKPMNVMMRQSSPDRPSIRKARSTLRSPAAIQVDTTSVRPAAPAFGSALKKASTDSRQAAAMARAATRKTVSRFHLRPKSMRIVAPRKGSSGMRRRLKVVMGRFLSSALHQRRFIEVDGLPAAEEADQNG